MPKRKQTKVEKSNNDLLLREINKTLKGKEYYLAVYRDIKGVAGEVGELKSNLHFWPHNFDFQRLNSVESITSYDGRKFEKPKEALEHYIFKMDEVNFDADKEKAPIWNGYLIKKYDYVSRKVINLDQKVKLQIKNKQIEVKLAQIRSL